MVYVPCRCDVDVASMFLSDHDEWCWCHVYDRCLHVDVNFVVIL